MKTLQGEYAIGELCAAFDVSRSDVEDSRWARGIDGDQPGEHLRWRSHHRRHAARKIQPDRMFRRHRPFCRLSGAAFAHRGGQFIERASNRG